MHTAIEDLRKMVRFYDAIDENINDCIRTVSEAHNIWCCANVIIENNGIPAVVINESGRVRVIDETKE